MNRKNGYSDNPVVVLLATVSALVTIVVFVTGYAKLPDLLRSLYGGPQTPVPESNAQISTAGGALTLTDQSSATLPSAAPSSPDAPHSTAPANTLPQVAATPDVVWILVPEGPFVMGIDGQGLREAIAECNSVQGNCEAGWFDQEQPRRQVTLSSFEVTKFEITNAQYDVCVQRRICSPAGSAIKDNNIARQPLFFEDNYPVVGVSLRDATTFCRWIGGRVPSEEEWEKAARGTDGRRYPWGEKYDSSRANLAQSGPRPVGSFLNGASPYGLMDMAGNVFEWTSSEVNGNYLVRGGSWFQPSYRGRTTDRLTKLPPEFANYDIGIRCAK